MRSKYQRVAARSLACSLLLTSALLVPAQAPQTKDTQAVRDQRAEQDQQEQLTSHIHRAQTYLQENHPDLALPELQAASAIDPTNVEVEANLGVLLFFRNSFANAIPHLRTALAAQPSLAKIQALLGIAELRVGDTLDARKDLDSAYPSLPENKFKTQAGLELVNLYTQIGDLAQAAITIAALRKTDPDNNEVTYAAYRTYQDLAGESMLALSLRAPDSAQFHQLMAHEETRQGNTNGAIAHYREAIAADPHLPGVHFELAELLNSSADTKVKQQAEQEYQEALKVNPQDEKAIRRIGEILDLRGDTAGALKAFTQATALQPSDADAKLDLAKVFSEMNQADQAITLLEETVQLEPTNATAHYRLGTLYRQKGRAEDAKREIDLYQKYKAEKEKLRALLKEMQIQPSEIESHEPDEK